MLAAVVHFQALAQVRGASRHSMKKNVNHNLFILCMIIVFHAAIATAAHAMEFSTKYSVIHYSEYSEMDDFLWRMGGERINFLNNTRLASSRIDRIVDRIQAILGVIPRDLRFNIYLRRGMLENDMKAYYDLKTKSIFISVDYASQGVLAHEISHAIIDTYFPASSPDKIKEIISQYVDKYLWSDYQ